MRAALGRQAAIQRRPHTQRQRQRALNLELQVGENIAHQGLIQQPSAEGLAARRVIDGLCHSLALRRGGADHTIKPRHSHHLDNRRYPAALIADHPAECAA